MYDLGFGIWKKRRILYCGINYVSDFDEEVKRIMGKIDEKQ